MFQFRTNRGRLEVCGAALTALAVGITLAACGSSSSSTASAGGGSSATSDSAGGTIVYVTSLTTEPFDITLYDGALAEAKKLGYNLSFQGPQQAGASPTVEASIFRAVLATKPKAILLQPSNKDAMVAPVQEAEAAGVPVITVDGTISNTSMLTAQVTSNDYQGGEIAAETIAKAHNFKGDVAVEQVPPGNTPTDLRLAGFEAQIRKYPDMKLVAVENGEGEETLSEAQARSVLLGYPNLVGFFGTNEEGGVGAGVAVQAAGKEGKITVVGFDAEPAEISQLKTGVLSAIIAQQAGAEGKQAVEYVVDDLTGKKSAIPQSPFVIPNVVVSAQNVNDPSIDQYFYTTQLNT